ncbi:hypothetical protein [Candidatus Steffania adelgidicola]|uniref:hypothetical protein n=1 Tax=Candidatus Steffania adelgidicola TaxID=1076626 RepID=UPI001D01758E|nr:hypothetical protein [Candidatus Steffania adelgidicola]
MLSSYLFSPIWLHEHATQGLLTLLLRFFSLLLSLCFMLVTIYLGSTIKVPACDALLVPATIGNIFALGEQVFALYITLFPSYSLIYGVLAVIRILFL